MECLNSNICNICESKIIFVKGLCKKCYMKEYAKTDKRKAYIKKYTQSDKGKAVKNLNSMKKLLNAYLIPIENRDIQVNDILISTSGEMFYCDNIHNFFKDWWKPQQLIIVSNERLNYQKREKYYYSNICNKIFKDITQPSDKAIVCSYPSLENIPTLTIIDIKEYVRLGCPKKVGIEFIPPIFNLNHDTVGSQKPIIVKLIFEELSDCGSCNDVTNNNYLNSMTEKEQAIQDELQRTAITTTNSIPNGANIQECIYPKNNPSTDSGQLVTDKDIENEANIWNMTYAISRGSFGAMCYAVGVKSDIARKYWRQNECTCGGFPDCICKQLNK